jgi:hypothetical protein
VSQPPAPPPLPIESVHALIDWADASAAWLRDEITMAEQRGHREHGGAAYNLRLYEGVGVPLREAYETRMDDQ